MNKTLNHEVPFVSVIIPVHNGAQRVIPAIESLMKLDYPLDKFEIIVIDNASTDNIEEVVKKMASPFKGSLRYVFEAKKGLSHARNKGIEEARGDIISFTDDDCVADRNWLKEVAQTFKDQGAHAVLGRIILSTPIPKDAWYPEWFIRERFAHVDYGDRVKQLDGESMVGANMSYRRELFEKYGRFNSNPIFHLCDDSEFSSRISKNGAKKMYCPGAIIYHCYELGRVKDNKFFRQSFYWGRASIFIEPPSFSGFRYFLFRFKQTFGQFIELAFAYIKKDRLKVFLIKCKISSNGGRCFQLIQNGFKYSLEQNLMK